MAGRIDARLEALGLALPEPMTPVATYVGHATAGRHVAISGQGPVWNGEIRAIGRLGVELDLAAGQEAARLNGLNLLAQLHAACGGNLDRARRCVQMTGFVAAAPDFGELDDVIAAAAELMAQVFAPEPRPAYSAAGAVSLPFGIPVEIDAIFELA